MTEDKKSEEQWVMSGPSEKKVSDFLISDPLEDESFSESEFDDPSLKNELENWGMDIPPALLSKNDDIESLDIPAVIETNDEYEFLDTSSTSEDETNDLSGEMDLNEGGEVSDSHSVEQAVEADSDNKPSILDHLGKNFFEQEDLTSELLIDDLVKDAEIGEKVGEFKSNLHELSSALKGENIEPILNNNEDTSAPEDPETLPEESDLEYPDMAAMVASAVADAEEDEILLPDNDDLAYPGEMSTKSNIEDSTSGPTSQLISANELSYNEGEQEAVEETDPAFNITQEMKTDLAKEIENSDEVDPNDFWATDDFPKIKKTLNKPITEVQASKQIKEDFFKELDEEDNFKIIPSKRFSSISLDEVSPPPSNEKEAIAFDEEMEKAIVEKVKQALTPALEKIVKELFSEKIEKIAWEVIPDLAENIIKHEVEEIAKQVYLSKDSGKN
jgi:hypothetical protein